jgi:heptosyltransferase-3
VVKLTDRGIAVTLFGAPAEEGRLRNIFGGLNVEFSCTTLRGFSARLLTLDLFIGLDSFGGHVAYLCGIPSIILTGSNDPELWLPPNAKAVFSSGGCPHWPCYNKPRCRGRTDEFICIKSVTVEDLIQQLPGTG